MLIRLHSYFHLYNSFTLYLELSKKFHNEIIANIANKSGDVKATNRKRLEVSSHLVKFIDDYQELDVAIDNDNDLKKILKLFANNFNFGTSTVQSLDSIASNDDDSSNLDMITSGGKRASVPRSMAFIGDEDIIGGAKSSDELNASKISRETNPIAQAVHAALDKLLDSPPPELRRESFYSEKLQRQVFYNEILALILVVKYGIGYRVSNGQVEIDPSQGVKISRVQGEKSAEISRVIQDKLGIEINQNTIRNKKWSGAAEEFMRNELSSLR
jgi:hypothetical protein